MVFRRAAVIDEDQEWLDVDFAELPEVDLLRRYIRIDTSATTGSEVAGAEFLAAELERIGLTPTIETFGDQHANVWAILEGKSPEALVLHSHIDVFPVDDPSTWDFDPFGGVIDQAWIYGRGVFDMKSLAIVQLLALEEIVQSGRQPQKSIIFLATGSEEVGSELGTRWILEQHPELRERFWTVLTEGGVVEPVNRSDIKYWGIEFGQKRFASGYLCAETSEELEELSRQITTWRDDAEELLVTSEVEAFAEAYGPSRDNGLYRSALENPHQVVLDESSFRQLPAYVQSLFRSEVVPFEPEPAPDGGFRMKVFFHLLPGQSLEEARQRLLPDWLVRDAAFTLGPPLGADGASPIDHPVFRHLLEAVREAYPNARVGPYLLPWSATDSRFFRQAGIASYGFSPFVIFSTETFRVDGTNERLSVPGYMEGFELYLDAVLRIVG
jgi:acetylornithine deacetylase/succinyl-diaminopimelate desuccinylase-like protein